MEVVAAASQRSFCHRLGSGTLFFLFLGVRGSLIK